MDTNETLAKLAERLGMEKIEFSPECLAMHSAIDERISKHHLLPAMLEITAVTFGSDFPEAKRERMKGAIFQMLAIAMTEGLKWALDEVGLPAVVAAQMLKGETKQ
jgi:hypothetical protein